MGYTILPPFAAYGMAAAIRYDDGSVDAAPLDSYKIGLQGHLLSLEEQASPEIQCVASIAGLSIDDT
jgi:hypothetical protein